MTKPNNTNSFQEGVDENPLYTTVLAPIKRLRKNSAFTLAEVLITLGIIGIVAAMVIPSLISSYQKHVTVTRLKQTYAQLAQAIKLSEGENGDVSGWNMGTSTSTVTEESETFVKTYIMPYMKYLHVCDGSKSHCSSIPKKNLQNTPDINNQKLYGVILTNGIELKFDPRDSHVHVLVDINGPATPNIRGKDVFSLAIKKDVIIPDFVNSLPSGLYMVGEGYTREQLINSGYKAHLCSKNGGGFSGIYCGALIKEDGWKISKDYPW